MKSKGCQALALVVFVVGAALLWFREYEDHFLENDPQTHPISNSNGPLAVAPSPGEQPVVGLQRMAAGIASAKALPNVSTPLSATVPPDVRGGMTHLDSEPTVLQSQPQPRYAGSLRPDIGVLLDEMHVLSMPTASADYSQQLLDVRGQLVELLSTDGAALDVVVLEFDQLMASGNLEDAEQLSEILSHIQDDAITRRAQTWLQQSQSEAQRQLALQLLKSQVIDDPDLSQAALDIVLWEHDNELWLQSVPHMLDLDAYQEAAGIIEGRIQDLMVADSPELRSRAVQKYATLARRPDQIQIMALLLQDEDPSVRLAAIRAMQNLSVYSDVTKTALLAVLASPQESATLKEAAIHALGQYALNDAELDIYEQYSIRADDTF